MEQAAVHECRRRGNESVARTCAAIACRLYGRKILRIGAYSDSSPIRSSLERHRRSTNPTRPAISCVGSQSAVRTRCTPCALLFTCTVLCDQGRAQHSSQGIYGKSQSFHDVAETFLGKVLERRRQYQKNRVLAKEVTFGERPEVLARVHLAPRVEVQALVDLDLHVQRDSVRHPQPN
eukprot:COSAG05_NODE_436_length_9838_cov_49.389876_7_plen_178_part_00